MIYQLIGFFGAFMSAVVTLSMIFMAKGKPALWTWVLFISVGGMVIGAFGYLMPELLPYPGLTFVGSTLLMVTGVSLSYYIEAGQRRDELGYWQRDSQLNAVRLVVSGFIIAGLITSVVAASIRFQNSNASGVMATLYRLEKKQVAILEQNEVMTTRIGNLETEVDRRMSENERRDSTFHAQSKARGTKILRNQASIEKKITQQKRVTQPRSAPVRQKPSYEPLQPRTPSRLLDTSRVKQVPFVRPKRRFFDLFSRTN